MNLQEVRHGIAKLSTLFPGEIDLTAPCFICEYGSVRGTWRPAVAKYGAQPLPYPYAKFFYDDGIGLCTTFIELGFSVVTLRSLAYTEAGPVPLTLQLPVDISLAELDDNHPNNNWSATEQALVHALTTTVIRLYYARKAPITKLTSSSTHAAAVKRLRQGKQLPYFSHHLVRPGQFGVRTALGAGRSHASPRQHDRMGHWRTLRSGAEIWVREAKVGDPARGIITKDYLL